MNSINTAVKRQRLSESILKKAKSNSILTRFQYEDVDTFKKKDGERYHEITKQRRLKQVNERPTKQIQNKDGNQR